MNLRMRAEHSAVAWGVTEPACAARIRAHAWQLGEAQEIPTVYGNARLGVRSFPAVRSMLPAARLRSTAAATA